MGYFRRGALVERFSTVATAGGTTALLNNSTTLQLFTGTLNQTISLPNATTCDGGSNNTGAHAFVLWNRSSGVLTVNNFTGGFVCSVPAGGDVEIHLTNDTTSAGAWRVSSFTNDTPLKITAGEPADASVRILSNVVSNTDGTDTNTPPISSVIPSVVFSSHNLQTGATSGASFLGAAIPNTTIGNYRRVGYTLLPSGDVQILYTPEAASLAATANPGTVFVKTGLPIGWLDVQANAANSLKSADAASNNIYNSVGGVSTIHRFGAGGGGGSGSGDANNFYTDLKTRLDQSLYGWFTSNIFVQDEDNLVDAVNSQATYDLANNYYKFALATDKLRSIQNYGNSFLGLNALDTVSGFSDHAAVELHAIWSVDAPLATYEVTRDGGLNWITLAMARVGTSSKYVGEGLFTSIVSPAREALVEYPTATTPANLDLNATITKRAVKVIVTAKSKYEKFTFKYNKVGAPSGSLIFSWVKDNTGSPGAEMLASNVVPVSLLTVGSAQSYVVDVPTILPPGTYWMVIETDAVYRASYVNAATEVEILSDSAGSYAGGNSYEYNGAWSATASRQIIFENDGFRYNLQARITSGSVDVALDGYGIFFGEEGGAVEPSVEEPQYFRFSGSLDQTEFTVTNFWPNTKRVRATFVNSGLTFIHPFFDVIGNKLKFDSGTFSYPGMDLILKVENTELGGSVNIDFAKINSLLAENGLGSENGTLDLSSAGKGIKIRRPDGTLRMVRLDDNDNLVIEALP